MPLILGDTTPIAKKPHQCDECSRQIEPGEEYRRQRSVGDDGAYTWKACAHCDALWMHQWNTDEDFRQDARDGNGVSLWDYRSGYPGGSIAELRLTVQFRRKWRDHNGKLYPVPTWPVSA